MIYLMRRTEFCASHRLHNPELSDEENLRLYGCCNNPHGHGHTYVLEVTIRGEVDPRTGMLINLADLKETIETHVVGRLDHTHLNLDVDFMAGVIPTAENLAVVIWRILAARLDAGCEMHEVRVWESSSACAIYRGD